MPPCLTPHSIGKGGLTREFQVTQHRRQLNHVNRITNKFIRNIAVYQFFNQTIYKDLIKGLTNMQKGTVYLAAIFIKLSNRFRKSKQCITATVTAFKTKALLHFFMSIAMRFATAAAYEFIPIRNSHIRHIYASYMNICGKYMSYML